MTKTLFNALIATMVLSLAIAGISCSTTVLVPTTPSPGPTATPTLIPEPTHAPAYTPGSTLALGCTFGLDNGNRTEVATSNVLHLMRFKSCTTGTLDQLQILFNTERPSGTVRLGVYADSSGDPAVLLLDAGETSVTDGWVTIDGLSLSVTSGTYYWLAYDMSANNGVQYLSGGPRDSHYWRPWTYGGLPHSKWATNANSDQYVISAHVTESAPIPTPGPTSTPTTTTSLGNRTAVRTLTLVPAYNNVSVYSEFNGDSNGNNMAVLEYRQTENGAWIRGVDMTVDRRTTLSDEYGNHANPYRSQWRAVIFGLSENTSYDVTVAYTDPDGIGGIDQQTVTVTTRNSNPPSNGINYYVATSGSDSNSGLSPGTAWRHIDYALVHVSAGEVVNIMPGTYHPNTEGWLTMTTSGTANNWITIRSYDMNDKAIIDWQGAEGAFDLSCSYIRIHGLDLRNPALWLVRIGVDQHDVIVEDCITVGSSGNYYAGSGILADEGSYNVTVQRNSMTCTMTTDGDNAAFFAFQSNGGHVVRDNVITGTWHDGIGGDAADSIVGGSCSKDCFIYNNSISGPLDDIIAANGPGLNSAIFNNTMMGNTNWSISSTNDSVAITPILIGPLYIVGNIMWGWGMGAFKQGGDPTWSEGYVYIYHNTCYSTFGGGQSGLGYCDQDFGHGATYRNRIYQNNIMIAPNVVHVVAQVDGGHNIFDYNDGILYPYANGFAGWWGGTEYFTFADWREVSGEDAHSISADPKFVDPATGNFHLESSSPCIDAGGVIAGINDSNLPWAYKERAPDMGAMEYDIETPRH